jgi:hypothetical protein
MRKSKWCVGHDPDKAEARHRRASKGGKAGGRGRPQRELADVKHRLSDLADGVLTGEVETGVGAVASQILNVFLRAVSVELKAKEQLELIDRMEAIERSLEDRPANGRGGTYVGF